MGAELSFKGMKSHHGGNTQGRVYRTRTNGNRSACKQLLMAAAAYNLKKLMSAISFKTVKSAVNVVKTFVSDKIWIWDRFILLNNKIFAMQ